MRVVVVRESGRRKKKDFIYLFWYMTVIVWGWRVGLDLV